MDILSRMKRCVLLRQVRFTLKAIDERVLDDLSEMEVLESLVNATRIEKKVRSISPTRCKRKVEYLYIIHSPTARCQIVYSKGKFVDERGFEIYYLLISANLAE